jgi:hypothetical protein
VAIKMVRANLKEATQPPSISRYDTAGEEGRDNSSVEKKAEAQGAIVKRSNHLVSELGLLH